VGLSDLDMSLNLRSFLKLEKSVKSAQGRDSFGHTLTPSRCKTSKRHPFGVASSCSLHLTQKLQGIDEGLRLLGVGTCLYEMTLASLIIKKFHIQ